MIDLFEALARTDHPVAGPLARWSSGSAPDVQVNDAGRALLAVSSDGLDLFRDDDRYRSYEIGNGVFADILGPLDADLPEPIVFFLAAGNQPGVIVDRLAAPLVWIVSLGEPYGFGETAYAIAHILDRQGIRRDADWFAGILTEHGLDPADPAWRSIVG